MAAMVAVGRTWAALAAWVNCLRVNVMAVSF